MKFRFVMTCLIVVWFSAEARGAQPSFDCAKAAQPVERLICNDADLARLDRALAERYAITLRSTPMDHRDGLKAKQRAWLAKRNDCSNGIDVRGCVAAVYGERMANLNSAGPSPARARQPIPQRAVKSKLVVLYSAEWCGICRKARRVFETNGIAFYEYDVEKDPVARGAYERLGSPGVPQIVVGNKRLTGFSEESFLRLYND